MKALCILEHKGISNWLDRTKIYCPFVCLMRSAVQGSSINCGAMVRNKLQLKEGYRFVYEPCLILYSFSF